MGIRLRLRCRSRVTPFSRSVNPGETIQVNTPMPAHPSAPAFTPLVEPQPALPQAIPAPLTLGILVSGSGSNLQAILDAIQAGTVHARVALVVSNVSDAYALERAQRAGIPTQVISHRHPQGRPGFEQALIEAFRQVGVEWIALAGFMRVLTGHFLQAFPGRVVNIHPALLPSFPGMHGQAQALAYGVRLAGATVHLVDEGVDTGPILCQGVVPVLEDDTEETLKARILQLEHQLYPRALQLLASGRVMVEGRRVRLRPEVTKAEGTADGMVVLQPSLPSLIYP